MNPNLKILCTICARGGSQGVKNKNIKKLLGKPLIAHTIIQAKKSGLFSAIAVSSDSPKIRDIAKQWGVDYVIDRPAEMATNTAAKLPAIQHAVRETERSHGSQFDVVIDLDATSPLRSVGDIRAAFDLFSKHKEALNLVTVYPARRSPYFNILEVDEQGYAKLAKIPEKPVYRRQDAPACYDINGSVYIWQRDSLFQLEKVITERTVLYVMPAERSIDIDSEIDFHLVKLLAKKRKDLN